MYRYLLLFLILLTLIHIEPIVYSGQNTLHVIRVPQDYPSITEAVENALRNTLILVSPGIYNETLSITSYRDDMYLDYNRNITIKGLGYVEIRSTETDKPCLHIWFAGNITLENLVFRSIGGIGSLAIVEGSLNILFKNVLFISENSSRPAYISLTGSGDIEFINTSIYNATIVFDDDEEVSLINTSFYGEGILGLGFRHLVTPGQNISETLDRELSSLVIENSSINGRPIVFLKNIDLSGRDILEEYSNPGQLILYKVSNIVIENTVFESKGTPITLYDAENIVFRNLVFKNNLYDLLIFKAENVLLENLSFSYDIHGFSSIWYEPSIMISNSIGTVLRRIYINISGNPYISSWKPYLGLLDNRYVNISDSILWNTYIHYNNIYVYIVDTRFYRVNPFSIPSLNIEYKYVKQFISTLEIHNCTYEDKALVKLENMEYNYSSLKHIYSELGVAILYNVAELYISGYVFENVLAPLIILDSRDISIENNTFYTGLAAYIYNSYNISFYLCYFTTNHGIFYIENSIVLLHSPTPVIYSYGDTIHVGYIGNYWVFETPRLVDLFRDGVGDNPVSVELLGTTIIDPYPLMAPPRIYRVVVYASSLDKLGEIFFGKYIIVEGLGEKYVSKNIDLVIRVSFPIQYLKITLTGPGLVKELAGYSNAYGNYSLTIDTREYRDGLYQLSITVKIRGINREYGWSRYIYIDNTPPKIDLISPRNNTEIYMEYVTVYWTIDESNLNYTALFVDGVEINVNDTNEINLEMKEPGRHNITLVAVDKAGNKASVTIFIVKKEIFSTPQRILLVVFLVVVGVLIILLVMKGKKISSSI